MHYFAILTTFTLFVNKMIYDKKATNKAAAKKNKINDKITLYAIHSF
jgi:hypothetical protein